MFIVVASRQSTAAAYVSAFFDEGIPSLGVYSEDLQAWIDSRSNEFEHVRGFLVDDSHDQMAFVQTIRQYTPAPIIALSEVKSLDSTLELLTAGVDDVVRRPVHVKEIVARSEAVWRRHREACSARADQTGRLKVFFSGQDPEIDGISLSLPRRERTILEFFVRHRNRPVNKRQVFKAAYDAVETDMSETVVETHISKLRRKLRERLGYDPIIAKRYEGYTFTG